MPYSVAPLAELPDSLRQAAMESIGTTNELISICVFPVRTYLKNWDGWEYMAEQALLFTRDRIFHIQVPASANHEAKIVSLHAADLSYTRLIIENCCHILAKVMSELIVPQFHCCAFFRLQVEMHVCYI